ncbi:uncharacterized protein LOC112569513 [Pomacea canaliculata]|uniref:uncharacterized protein LOC112569513 n=1 Tax=Pomacea canaliculata TaxID=400727 RepID=UPI000D730A83|nr:uncharacterized protein LOC112569513 [Pomacea canaliculata]
MTVSFIMKNGFIYIQLVLVTAQGSTDTDCVAKHGNNLMCKFPENINSTRKDFAVYFYPDTGGEEPLVDCGWMDAKFDCIEQEGFKCKQPVSDSANITVPVRFVNRTGSYRCKTDGIRLENMNPCRFNETQVQVSENKLNSWCEAHSALEGRQLIVNCAFSIDVENFTVEYNKTVVASYTKSFCQTSDVCSFGHNPHSAIVKLDNPGNLHGELRCHPDHPTLQLEVKSCSVDTKRDTETFPTVTVVLPVIFVLTALSVAVVAVILRKRWKARNKERNQKKNAWRKLPMSDKSDCSSAEMP